MAIEVPSIEELIKTQLEEIERLKSKINEEKSYSVILVLRRKLEETENALEPHKEKIREMKINELLNN